MKWGIKGLFLSMLFLSCQRYQGPPDYVCMQSELVCYAQDVAKTCGLHLLLVDNVTPSPDVSFCMAFTSTRPLILEEARAVSEGIVSNFQVWLSKNPAVGRYRGFKRVNLNEIGLKISFWDKDMNRIPAPYVAEVVFADGQFYYFQKDDESERIRLILKVEVTQYSH